jgi:HEAT repeats/Putative zinc-finger
MNCEKIRERIPECLAGRLDKAARETVVEHLETCAACRTEVAELNAVWRGLETLKPANAPAPDAAAKTRFMEMLEAYRAGLEVGQVQGSTRLRGGRFAARPVWQAAMAAGLLIGGIFFGRYQFGQNQVGQNPARPASGEISEVTQLRGQVESLRQLVTLSMLQQQSPSARLRGVTYSEQMARPDQQVEQALLFAVSHDTNVNVRLSAVDALQKYGGNPEVVRAMLDAIPVQESPMVQIALIDMLVQLNAANATPGLVKLSRDKQVVDVVRQRAAWAAQKMEAAR